MTERELVEEVILSVDLLKAYGSRACFMEKVGQIRGDSAQGAFTFGHIDGLLRGALYASGINPCSVYPQAWQAAMECPTGGQKNISKARAAGLFPGEKITHTIADSLLIAEYGRRRLSL